MPTWAAWWVRAGFRPFFFVVVPIAMVPRLPAAMLGHVKAVSKHACEVMHYYIELRREIQSLFVVTSWGRLVHVTVKHEKRFWVAVVHALW